MIQIYLHNLMELDPPKHFIPTEPRTICRGIELDIAPECADDEERELRGLPAISTEPVEGEKPEPKKDPIHVPFDKTPLGVLADWCKENDETWLERACRFIVKRPEIVIYLRRAYGNTYYWAFLDESMPDRWRYIDSDKSVLGLLCTLAREIEKRTRELE